MNYEFQYEIIIYSLVPTSQMPTSKVKKKQQESFSYTNIYFCV